MANVEMIDGASAAQMADWLEQQLKSALSASDKPQAITVPGGSTPFPIMEQFVPRNLDWSRVIVWPGDDRVVPEDHEASNTGKLRAIFEPVGAEVAALTIMEKIPRFSLCWLGMGADGHIASLFPNTNPQVTAPQSVIRLTPDPLPPEAPFDRISLTIPSLLASDTIVFTLGENPEKRRLFEAAARGDNDLPIARFLGATDQKVTCFT